MHKTVNCHWSEWIQLIKASTDHCSGNTAAITLTVTCQKTSTKVWRSQSNRQNITAYWLTTKSPAPLLWDLEIQGFLQNSQWLLFTYSSTYRHTSAICNRNKDMNQTTQCLTDRKICKINKPARRSVKECRLSDMHITKLLHFLYSPNSLSILTAIFPVDMG